MALESDYAGKVRSYAFKASLLMLASPKSPTLPYPTNVLLTENPDFGHWFLCSSSLQTHLEKAHKLREIKINKNVALNTTPFPKNNSALSLLS